MTPSRRLTAGLILLVGGLVVIAFGTIVPSGDPLVALGWLLGVPSLASACGAAFVSVTLARRTERGRSSTAAFRIVGSAAMAGVGLALVFGVVGILSQVPDSLAGLNGAFVASSAPGLSAFVLCGAGLSAGLVIGAIAALGWRSFGAGEGT